MLLLSIVTTLPRTLSMDSKLCGSGPKKSSSRDAMRGPTHSVSMSAPETLKNLIIIHNY